MEFTVTCKIYDSYEDQDSGRKGDLDARNPLNHAKMRTSSTLPALFYPLCCRAESLFLSCDYFNSTSSSSTSQLLFTSQPESETLLGKEREVAYINSSC